MTYKNELPFQFYVMKALYQLTAGERTLEDSHAVADGIDKLQSALESGLDQKVAETLDWMSRHGYAYSHSPTTTNNGTDRTY